jgi:hypothetical protein
LRSETWTYKAVDVGRNHDSFASTMRADEGATGPWRTDRAARQDSCQLHGSRPHHPEKRRSGYRVLRATSVQGRHYREMGGSADGPGYRRRFGGRGWRAQKETKDECGCQGQRGEAPRRLIQDAWRSVVDASRSVSSVAPCSQRLPLDITRWNPRRDCREGYVQNGTAEWRDPGIATTVAFDLGLGDEHPQISGSK